MEQVDIEGLEGYQITDDGRVWSKKTNKYLKPNTNKGYRYVTPSINGTPKSKFIYKLVAQTFVENPDPSKYTEVDHIIPISEGGTDEASNLRWTDRSGNMTNPYTVEKLKNRIFTEETKKKMSYAKQHLSDEARKNMSLAHIGQISARRKKVRQYTKDNQLINEYESVTDAANKNNYNISGIGDCCRGKLKTYKGYKWSYE